MERELIGISAPRTHSSEAMTQFQRPKLASENDNAKALVNVWKRFTLN